MLKLALTITFATILCQASGCASQPVALQACPKPASLPAVLAQPAPDPTLFSQCLTALLAQTLVAAYPPSCSQLEAWQSISASYRRADVSLVPQIKSAADSK